MYLQWLGYISSLRKCWSLLIFLFESQFGTLADLLRVQVKGRKCEKWFETSICWVPQPLVFLCLPKFYHGISYPFLCQNFPVSFVPFFKSRSQHLSAASCDSITCGWPIVAPKPGVVTIPGCNIATKHAFLLKIHCHGFSDHIQSGFAATIGVEAPAGVISD